MNPEEVEINSTDQSLAMLDSADTKSTIDDDGRMALGGFMQHIWVRDTCKRKQSGNTTTILLILQENLTD